MSSIQISNKTDSSIAVAKTKIIKKKTKTPSVVEDENATEEFEDEDEVEVEDEGVLCKTCDLLSENICDKCNECCDLGRIPRCCECEDEEGGVLTGKIDKKDMKMLSSIGATYEELKEVQDKIEKCDMLNSRHLAIYDAFKTDTTEGRKQKQAFVMKLQCSPQMLDMLQKALPLPSSFSREGGYTQDAIKAGIDEFVMGCWDKLRSYEAMDYFDGKSPEKTQIVQDFINTDFLGGFLSTERGVEVMGLKQREHEERVGHKRKNTKKPGMTKNQVIDTMTDEELMAILKARQANKA